MEAGPVFRKLLVSGYYKKLKNIISWRKRICARLQGGKFMVVQHNLTAMNSNRMLGLTTATQAKSTEKLSSGYKINRAADDAAGLSISEKMRKQIRGLTQASANAEDGISAVQTAEGALTEVHDMLQRMNELAVKASNGTMSENDREYVQNEIDQLVTEIDRVAETTKFNETYLLKGDGELKSAQTTNAVNITADGKVKAQLNANSKVNAGDYSLGTVQIKTSNFATNAGNMTGVESTGTTVDSTNSSLQSLMNQATSTGKLTLKVVSETIGSPAKDADDTYAKAYSKAVWTISDGTNTLATATTEELASKYGITLAATGKGTPLAKAATVDLERELVTSTEQQRALQEANIAVTTNTADSATLKNYAIGQDLKATIGEATGTPGQAELSAYNRTSVPSALDISLHVGADSTSNNKIQLSITSMSAKSLGLTTEVGSALKVDGKDSTNADKAIDTIAAAIQKVSTQRSALGAVQNRLEHTINNLDNVVENTTSAESAIRDTDMATEMVKYSNNNILAQAGQAMLAQANQSNQGVLSLLG